MKKSIIAILAIGVAGLASAQAPASKPGLWETKIVKQVVDGKDMTAQINGAMAQLANLPPEQRAMIEAHMKGAGMNGTSIRVCISPAMAAKHEIGGDPRGHCPPASIEVNGNTTNFAVNCTYQGRTTVGKGQAVVNGDSIAVHVDMKETDSNGSHTVISDTQMSYLGSDCQGIKPLDQK
ncbi:MAG: DUF3617 domain-containing protein [Burkholderiaceae bacterium]|nr:DUF3617 domain-containing protein [Burkholderiaceae bacterium]